MNLSNSQILLLRALVQNRLNGGKLYLTMTELNDQIGSGTRISLDDVEALSAWCHENALPDVATTVIPPENAEHMRMLPGQAIIDRLGGETAAQAEAARVRDFDWTGWAST